MRNSNDNEGSDPSMEGSQPERRYEVGYGLPPRKYRFEKGHSGNPAGARAQKKFNLQGALSDTLAERVVVRANGRERRATGLEALTLAQMQRALQRDLRAIRYIVKLAKKTSRFSDPRKIGGVYERKEPHGQQDFDLLEYRELKAAGKDPWDYVDPEQTQTKEK